MSDDNEAPMEKEVSLMQLECEDSKNNDDIIIEIYGTTKINHDGPQVHDSQDAPELISMNEMDHCFTMGGGDVQNTAALCEALYESDASNDFSEPAEPDKSLNILDDIPNEVLVYTCQPETSTNPLHNFTCKSCSLITGCIFCLKSHYESIHLNLGLIQYKCEQTWYLRNYTEICHKCNLVCESKDEMIEHRKIHFVSCDVCDMSFDSALFLSNHCKTTHEKFEVIISCDLCEQWFKQLQDLSDHYQQYHEMIVCIVCFKRFSNEHELTQHHGTHKIVLTDVRPILPYACSKCNQAFGEISELSGHLIRDHPNPKASYGSISRKRVTDSGKHRTKRDDAVFDDCGGLSQNDSVVEMEDGSGRKNGKKLKSDH